MVKEISGMRIARSFITPTDSVVTRELDFQLGPQMGIGILGVLGDIRIDANAWTPSPTALTTLQGRHGLHFETGSLEGIADEAGEDEDTIDSELFYLQSLSVAGIDEPTAQGAVSVTVNPTTLFVPPRPLFTSRNISHSGISIDSTLDLLCNVLIYYVFVEFSLSELGLILARRQ